ncbi:M56 family metallopeptidase [Roseibium sp.]|uniref:M56 family metallopeptidase n=1 Tax=Roseibium sp. TaxID=1936156 RepID=UPI003B522A50
MTVVATVIAINGALLLTLAILGCGRILSKRLNVRFDARSEVMLLRAALALSAIIPLSLQVAKLTAGFEFFSLTIPVDPSGGFGVLGARIFEQAEDAGVTILVVAGAALMFSAWLMIEILRLRLMIHKAPLMTKRGRVTVRCGAVDQTPCAFLHPCGVEIFVPKGLSAQARRAVLLHEGTHLRNGDLHWNWIRAGFSLFCGWNPAFWVWCRWHRQLSEHACDRHTLNRGLISPVAYAESLVAVAALVSTRRQLPQAAVAFLGQSLSARTDLKLRLGLLFEEPVSPCRRGFYSAVTGLIVAINLAAASVHFSYRPWSIEGLEISMYQNLHRMAEAKQLPAFGLMLAY